jgi:DNA-directed RNA polymerase subunit beta'
VKISPLVVKGYGADHDGDMMNYHVPVSDEAAREAAERMLPSKNLFSPADFKSPLYAPTQEYTGGLFVSTRPPTDKRRPHRFASQQAVLQALARGDIAYDDVVEVHCQCYASAVA